MTEYYVQIAGDEAPRDFLVEAASPEEAVTMVKQAEGATIEVLEVVEKQLPTAVFEAEISVYGKQKVLDVPATSREEARRILQERYPEELIILSLEPETE